MGVIIIFVWLVRELYAACRVSSWTEEANNYVIMGQGIGQIEIAIENSSASNENVVLRGFFSQNQSILR